MESLEQEFSKEELLITNTSFLGLTQKAWEFSRGARTKRLYIYDTGETAVKDEYQYTWDQSNSEVVGMVRTLTWYTKLGEEIVSKDISPELNIKNLKKLNRDIRQGRLDYMVAAGIELASLSPYVPEPYKSDFLKASDCVDIILKFYDKEINEYIEKGIESFYNAVNNEQNPVMLEILSLGVRPPDVLFPTGLTIQETIKHQLTGQY